MTRVAEIIAPRSPRRTADELRAIAFGWLARPPSSSSSCWSTATPKKSSTSDRGGPARATAFPADLLDALKTADLTPLAPKTVLYVHLHEAALHGVPGGRRVEGLGPVHA